MENELKKLAAAMRDMSDMVGDHHWQAAKAIEELGTLRAELDRMNRVADANSLELCRALEELKALKSKPINIGALDPQQRLDVARGEKLGADGLEVVAAAKALCKHHAELCGVNPDDQWTHYSEDFLADVQIVAPYLQADAQRLLSQLREELAQRDAEVARLRVAAQTNWNEFAESMKTAPLESQQAASVGGEREQFEAWHNRAYGPQDKFNPIRSLEMWPDETGLGYKDPTVEAQFFAYRAALSPAGGGVVPDALGRAFITSESGGGSYRVVIKSAYLQETQQVHNWLARLLLGAVVTQSPAHHRFIHAKVAGYR